MLSRDEVQVPGLCCGECCLVSVAYGPLVVLLYRILSMDGNHRLSLVGACASLWGRSSLSLPCVFPPRGVRWTLSTKEKT